MSLSKNKIKVIQSLQRKKGRIQHGLFLAEGIKVVQELVASSFELHSLYVTEGHEHHFDAEFEHFRQSLSGSVSSPRRLSRSFRSAVSSPCGYHIRRRADRSRGLVRCFFHQSLSSGTLQTFRGSNSERHTEGSGGPGS